MEKPSFLEDPKVLKLLKKVTDVFAEGNYNKVLEIVEDLILVHKEDKDSWYLHFIQGRMFLKLKKDSLYATEIQDMDLVYLLAAVEYFSEDVLLSRPCACGLRSLGAELGSVFYYKKCMDKAKQALSVTYPYNTKLIAQASLRELRKDLEEEVKILINSVRNQISVSKTSPLKNLRTKVWESKKSPDLVKNEDEGLKSYWVGLDVKIKRDFMKVSIAKLISFVERVHHREGRDALEQVLTSAREDRKWTFWMCRTKCSKKLSSAEECENHFERQHDADVKHPSKKDRVQRIGQEWVRKISLGVWEPVDAVAAVEMIKNRLADVKAFAPKNGWSNEWPLAVDEDRRELLNEIKLLLVLYCDRKILSCSIREWLMRLAVQYLGKLEIPEQSLVDSHLVGTPQSICFLESHELNQILNFLKTIKCERNDGTDLVCNAVKSFLGGTQVKEKIDFDPQFLFLLLDKRLLRSKNVSSDDGGKINVYDPNVHYAKAHAEGDEIISWLTEYNSIDKIFPKPIREHNLDIWVAILKAVQFTCRTLGTKYAKKSQVLEYDEALTVIENMCMIEDVRRKDLQADQWNKYASLLCNRCEASVPGNSIMTRLFLCAVRDVLEGALFPRFDFPDLEECLNLIREHKNLVDDIVLKSIHYLKSAATQKVLQIDSKILLIDNSRISLLKSLTKLSVFDNRTYILQLLKPFLLNEIVNMDSKAKSDAAEAYLLLDEEKKSRSRKKKNKSNKRTSTSMSSPLDKTVEHEPSANLGPGDTSPSLKTVEEDSLEPEDTLTSERDRLKISSNIDNQERPTKDDLDMQNLPGEGSSSEHLESALVEVAVRYNSALDMTLKALLNINILKEDLMSNMQPNQDSLEEQVPCALQNLFAAFVSEVIRNEGVYSCLLRDLLISLEEFCSMVCVEKLSDAAEVVVAILEFWHFWKYRERESLVNRLFTLEVNERMSCIECRRKPNYPEQPSHGIVMAADSIRDLMTAFGNIVFVDILKVIYMEYEMLCDIKTGGCGTTNIVHHVICRCPPIFTIVLDWEKNETRKEISETTKALECEIDISRLYEGLEPNTNYRLVSMVGCGEVEKEHICIAYEKNRWVNLRRESLEGEDVGDWKSVVRFCSERSVRPEILFYEAV